MSRPSTSTGYASPPLPGRRSPGVKGTLARLQQQVGDHDVLLQRLSRKEEQEEEEGNDMFEQMQRRFEGIMDEMRTEMTDKLKAAYLEIERLQKKLAIVKGEQEIQKSQLRDQSRGVQGLQQAVSELQRDLNGDGGDDYD
jgi:hypothetical protein